MGKTKAVKLNKKKRELSMMNIENLRIFCLVVEEGSISQAVKQLYLSQPAATRKIHQLEDFYGALLFDRENGKLTVSSVGQVLYPMAKSIVAEFDRSKEVIHQITEQSHIHIKIGASLTIGEYLLPKILGRFKKKYPDYQVTLDIGNTPTMINSLLNDTIDLAIVEGMVDGNDQLIVKHFKDDSLNLVCSPQHPWNKRKEVLSSELVGERMIWREETSGTRTFLENVLDEAGVLPHLNNYMELGSTQAIKGAVEANLGISILPDITTAREVEQNILYRIKITDLTIKRKLWIVQKKHRFEQVGITQLIHLFNE